MCDIRGANVDDTRKHTQTVWHTAQRWLRRLLVAIALLISPAPGVAQDEARRPLLSLLSQIPVGAKGIISLSDIAASKRQTAPFAETVPDKNTRLLIPHTSLYHEPNGISIGSFPTFAKDGASSALGFSIFDITQIAGWGEQPAAPMVIAGVSQHVANIEAALGAREFETTNRRGYKVWHRGRDHETYTEHRDEDPFSARLNSSQRFAVKDGFLLFSRVWTTMNKLLDSDSSLGDTVNVAAIIRAGYVFDDAGDLIDAVLLHGQPKTTLSSTPNLPPFTHYGLLLWQNGAVMTGAIVIPYSDTTTAATARDRFISRIDTLKVPSVGRLFSDILPWHRRIEIIENSGHAVLILGFQSKAETSQPINLLTFMHTPHRRLVAMFRNHDLDVLIGHSK
ncbi:MAG: hypothetical protein GY927_24520 [bacterium]|nr:hypothetical protein [bacterium]